jgi:hypothetical protein
LHLCLSPQHLQPPVVEEGQAYPLKLRPPAPSSWLQPCSAKGESAVQTSEAGFAAGLSTEAICTPCSEICPPNGHLHITLHFVILLLSKRL